MDLPTIKPRIIIHGGAGNITRENLPAAAEAQYRSSLLQVLESATNLLNQPHSTALEVATHAVSLLEDCPLFNCGHGAVFTRAGTIELESSIMVSNGYRKRGVGCMLLSHVKNPIKLAREMLVRGEEENGGGAYNHTQLSGAEAERLARQWGLELVETDYFWTKRRWEEHLKGLEREKGPQLSESNEKSFYGNEVENEGEKWNEEAKTATKGGDSHWNGKDYLPQGTVGAVVLDRFGTICAATSTGGLTNKLPGRIGDTPTLGAGFWAEEWFEETQAGGAPDGRMLYQPTVSSSGTVDKLSRGDLPGLWAQCLPSRPRTPESALTAATTEKASNSDFSKKTIRRAVAMSGTGNGDSFLRVCAARTAASISRFSGSSLSTAVARIAGPGGELQKSAGDRWGKTGEGEGGIIGIEFRGNEGKVVYNLNCGGMFRAWVDDEGNMRSGVWKDDE